MPSKVDIFRGKPDDSPLWVQTAESLDEAKDQVRRLAASIPDEYFVFDPSCGTVIHLNRTEPASAAA